jgi:hypothetical protein
LNPALFAGAVTAIGVSEVADGFLELIFQKKTAFLDFPPGPIVVQMPEIGMVHGMGADGMPGLNPATDLG